METGNLKSLWSHRSLPALCWTALWKQSCFAFQMILKSWGETLQKNCGLFFPPLSPPPLTILELIDLQGDVWICMELMDTSLDKFYKQVIDKGQTIPEDILGKIAVSVSTSWTLPTRGNGRRSRFVSLPHPRPLAVRSATTIDSVGYRVSGRLDQCFLLSLCVVRAAVDVVW